MDYLQAILGALCIVAIKVLDLEDPDTVFWARCAFACGSTLTILTMALLYMRITQANDQHEMTLTNAELNPPQPMAAMLGAPAAPDANKQTTVTNCEYDLMKLKSLAQTALTTICFTTALHVWKGFMPPLILQSILGMSGLLQSELASIHFFNRSTKQDPALKRPWKVKSMFSGFNDLKKEMSQAARGEEGGKGRKNKKAENMVARKTR